MWFRNVTLEFISFDTKKVSHVNRTLNQFNMADKNGNSLNLIRFILYGPSFSQFLVSFCPPTNFLDLKSISL